MKKNRSILFIVLFLLCDGLTAMDYKPKNGSLQIVVTLLQQLKTKLIQLLQEVHLLSTSEKLVTRSELVERLDKIYPSLVTGIVKENTIYLKIFTEEQIDSLMKDTFKKIAERNVNVHTIDLFFNPGIKKLYSHINQITKDDHQDCKNYGELVEKYNKNHTQKEKLSIDMLMRGLKVIKDEQKNRSKTSHQPSVKKQPEQVFQEHKNFQKYDLPKAWNVANDLKSNIIWIPSIQQYNGWLCGWMALYNADKIVAPLFQRKFTVINDFISAIQNHKKNQFETRYANFVIFQKKFAMDIYNNGNVKPCGALFGRHNQIKPYNNDDKNIKSLDDCLLPADFVETGNTVYCMLADDQVASFLKKEPKFTNYVIAINQETDTSEILYEISPKTEKISYGNDIDLSATLQKSPQNCIAIVVYASHIILLIKWTQTDEKSFGKSFIVMMNSENIHDDSFKSERTGNVIKSLCRSFLNK